MVKENMPAGSRMAMNVKQSGNAHDRDRIIVRLPDGIRDQIAKMADENGRSMTAEVVAAIEDHLARPTTIAVMQERIEDLADELRIFQLQLAETTLRTAFIVDHLGVQIPSSLGFEGDAQTVKKPAK